jgi:hypothetical protein
MSSFSKSMTQAYQNKDSAFFLCECAEELVALYKEDDQLIELSIWQRSLRPKSTWRSRIRNCWHILRYGHPYCDQVVLSKHKARELAEKLFEFSCDKDVEQKT